MVKRIRLDTSHVSISCVSSDENPLHIALAAFTGCDGKLLGLRWKDIDLNGKRLYLPNVA